MVSTGLIPGSSFRPSAFLPLQTASAAPPSSFMKPPSTILSTARAGKESPFSCLTMSPPGKLHTKVNLVGLSGNLYRAPVVTFHYSCGTHSLLSPTHVPIWQWHVPRKIGRHRILSINATDLRFALDKIAQHKPSSITDTQRPGVSTVSAQVFCDSQRLHSSSHIQIPSGVCRAGLITRSHRLNMIECSLPRAAFTLLKNLENDIYTSIRKRDTN